MAFLKELAIDGRGHYGIGASAVEKNDNLYTYLRITDIRDNGTLNMADLKSIDDPDADKYILAPNDIVFARTGASTGRNYFYDGSDGIFVYAGFLIKFSIDPEKVNPLYIKYYCQSAQYRNWISSFSTGSTRGNINAQTLGNMEIPLPCREQQDFLVNILAPLDAKIKQNEQINCNLFEQMQLLYQNLLDSCECSLIRLEEVSQKIAMGPFGSNIKVSTFVPEGVPIISGNHLRSVFLEEPSYNYITEEHAQRLKNSMVYPRDIVFTHAGNIGQVAMIPAGCDYPYYMISQRQFYMRCDESKVIPEIVLFFFHSREGRGKLLANANSTGVPSIAQPSTHLKNIEMPMPPKEDQNEWYKIIDPMVKKYVILCRENKRLATLRNSLLPKLMSGEIDVSTVEI